MIRRAKNLSAYYRRHWRIEHEFGWQFVWVDLRWIITGKDIYL